MTARRWPAVTARRWAAVLLVAALAAASALALAACGEEEGTGGGTGGGEPVQGGTLKVTYQGEPTGLDPTRAWELESWAIERLTYETFLTYASEPGEAGTELVPCLATEVPSVENGGISEDGRVYTFKLREGVKFAPPVDRELTADDFKYSFERMLKDPEAPYYFYSRIVGVDDFVEGKADEVQGFQAVDPLTVQITLSEPDPSILFALTMPFTSAVPREWVAQQGKKMRERPLGTGPFIIEEWVPGQRIVAKRNPNYWDEGKPYLDEIDFDLTVNSSTALLRLQNGEVDVLGDSVPAADYQRVKNDPKWGQYLVDAPQVAWYYVFMNVLEKPFDEKLVRQAVNYAIDTGKLQKLLGGQGTVLNQIYPSSLPGYQPDATFYTYDPEKARELLAEAGYPDGFTTTFYGHNVEPFPKLAQAIQADLKAVGIDASIKLMDRATYWEFISYRKSHAGIGLSDWYQDFPDPSDWIGPLFTNPEDGGMNSSFWENDEVNRLYAESSTELDPEKRLEMFVQMQEIIMDEAPTAPLFEPLWNGMYGENVGGYYYHPVWNLNFQDFWKLDGK